MTGDSKPYFVTHVFCCTNRRVEGHPRGCCAEKNSEVLRNYLKQRCKDLDIVDIRINAAGCLDRCELGPTLVIYPEGVWYGYKTKEDLDEILSVHILGQKRVNRLLLSPEDGPDKS